MEWALLCPELWEAQPVQTHLWESRHGRLQNKHPWEVHTVGMDNVEQEELKSGEDGFSGRKSPPEVPSDCLSVPLEHSGSAAPVLSQKSAWCREEHTVPLGSCLALPYQLSTMHRSRPKAGGCWERSFPGGKEALTMARAAAGTQDNIPFHLQRLQPFPKGCVCLDYLSLRTSPCRARSEEPRIAQRC